MKYLKNIIILTLTVLSLNALAQSESDLAAKFAEAVEDAGKYALTEMRPTAGFNSASLQRIRRSDREEGGDIKARVSTYWTTAFTGKSRTTVIDVWFSIDSSGIYLTRYKLFSDDHNIPIANPQDVRVKVKLSSSGGGAGSKRDNF